MRNPGIEKKVLAIIPARGGSKGIPGKNLVDIGGKPLIAYSIQTAMASGWINRVVVSTEDDTIARISRQWGAEIPFKRPMSLAGDRALLGDAVNSTIDMLRDQNYVPDIFVVLFPTHPFRPPQLVNALIERLLEGHKAVYTIKRIPHTDKAYFSKCPDGRMSRLSGTSPYGICHRIYGTLIGFNPNGIKNPYLHVLKDPIAMIDIDTEMDLEFARKVVEFNLYKDYQS